MLKRLDDTPVWSIVCFYLAKRFRGQGLTQALITGAVDYVRRAGGKVVEAYPTQPKSSRLPSVSSYMGLPAMFAKLGLDFRVY